MPPLSRYVRQCLRQIFISSPEGPAQNQLFKRANFRHGILSGDSHEGRAVRLFSRKILARGVLCRHPMQEGIPRFPVCTGKFVAGLFPPPGRAALALFNGRGRGIECQPKRPPAYAGKFASKACPNNTAKVNAAASPTVHKLKGLHSCGLETVQIILFISNPPSCCRSVPHPPVHTLYAP